MNKYLKSIYILPIGLLSALALVAIAINSKSPLDHTEPKFPTKPVEFVYANTIPFRTTALAHGNVEPSVTLRARSEVSGKIAYLHPDLKRGASLLKGTVVLQIEPTTFEFSLDKSKAGLTGSRSNLEQLDVEEASTRRTLSIAEKNLKTGEKELARIMSIWEKRLVARSIVDSEEQKVLQLRQQVEDLKGKLASFSSRKSVIRSQINQSQTQLAQSEDTLGRTEIRLPFDARIGEVSVETGEYIPLGSLLFEALGTEAIEINAQLPIGQFYPLLLGLQQQGQPLQQFEDFKAAFPKLALSSTVRLVGNHEELANWEGQLLRIGESIDPTRNTIGVVVAVNNPYQGVIPGKRPPLLKGMFASVKFITPPRKLMVVPRKAIHQGRIYIVKNSKGTDILEIREVEVLFNQGELVVLNQDVKHPIKEGEKIIITEVIPVLNNLPIQAVHATNYQNWMMETALNINAKTKSSSPDGETE